MKEIKAKATRLKDIWFRMDNSAVIYPMSITATTQSLFRMTAVLTETVDDELLEQALHAILPRYPSFTVQLRRGFFRYYFDHNHNMPTVSPESGRLFQKIDFKDNNRFLFRVTYYKNKISVDYFHALCDGTGAFAFLKSLVYQYLETSGKTLENDGSVKRPGEEIPAGEMEDSFLKYNKEYKLFGGVIGKMAGKNAVQMRGKQFRKPGYGAIVGYIQAEEIKAAAKKYDCSISAFVTAVALLSIAETHITGESKEDLVAMVPVDLRRIFPSETLANFTSLIKCAVNPNTVPRTVEAYCAVIKDALIRGADKDELQEKLSLSNFMGVKWYTKILPAVVKSCIIRLGKLFSPHTKQTLIISNLGIAKMPPSAAEHIQGFNFNVNVSRKAPKNMGVITFNGVTSVSFTRRLISTEVEKRFFTRLMEEGCRVSVVSNMRELKIQKS